MRTWIEEDCPSCGKVNWLAEPEHLSADEQEITRIECVHCGHKFDLLDDPEVADEGVCAVGLKEPH